MPVIKVWCLPKQTEKELRALHRAIVGAVISIPELGLNHQNDVTVLFPTDMMKYGLGQEIIVEITGLFKKPKRTLLVLHALAVTVGKAVKDLYPKAKVECFVQSFDPKEGFWTSDEKSDQGGNPLAHYTPTPSLQKLHVRPSLRLDQPAEFFPDEVESFVKYFEDYPPTAAFLRRLLIEHGNRPILGTGNVQWVVNKRLREKPNIGPYYMVESYSKLQLWIRKPDLPKLPSS